ncbi:MAG TPA: VCBS repeat-containing protein, partial [Myxococcaceae bacterium]
MDRKCDFTCKPFFRLCGSGCRNEAEVTVRPVEVSLGTLVRSLAVGDFNQDGLSDVAAVTGDYQKNIRSRLWVLHGTANGKLFSVFTSPLEDDFYEVSVADANHDGWQDVVVGRWFGGRIQFFWNEQGGQFRAEAAENMMDDAKAIVARDIDGDGKVDLLIAGREGPGAGVVVYRGDGQGKFGQRTSFPT